MEKAIGMFCSIIFSSCQRLYTPWEPGGAPGCRFHKNVDTFIWLGIPGVSLSVVHPQPPAICWKLLFKCFYWFMALLASAPDIEILLDGVFPNIPVFPDFRVAVWQYSQFKKSNWFSVCPNFFCCKNRSDSFSFLYRLELKPKTPLCFFLF